MSDRSAGSGHEMPRESFHETSVRESADQVAPGLVPAVDGEWTSRMSADISGANRSSGGEGRWLMFRWWQIVDM